MARSKELLKALQSIWSGERDGTDSEPRATLFMPDALELAAPNRFPEIPWPSNHLAARVEQIAAENPALAAPLALLQATVSSVEQRSPQPASGDVHQLAGRAGVS